jgi:hypothetical protein
MPGVPPPAPVAPWHMWGTTERVSIAAAAAPTVKQTVQLLRINYRRPENWRFWFGTRILGGSTSAADKFVRVRFNVLFGVGRSVFQTAQLTNGDVAFAVFNTVVAGGIPPGTQLQNVKYTDRVQTPLMDDNDPTSFHVVDHVVAQDVQCTAEITFGGGPGDTIDVEATAYFAPNVHVRPDWWQPAHRPGPHGDPMAAQAQALRFLGTETGGT